MKRFAYVLAVFAIVGLAASIASASTIYPTNNGFETPVTASAIDGTTANSSWTPTLLGNHPLFYVESASWASTTYSGGQNTGWVGDQCAQLVNGMKISQSVSGFLAGPATVSFLANKQSTVVATNSFTVMLDGITLTFGGVSPVTATSYAFTSYTSDPITVTAGTHTLSFVGQVGVGYPLPDARSSLDNVSISTTAIPEPATLVLLAAGLIGLLCYAWRKRR